jgi:hypothetical protein
MSRLGGAFWFILVIASGMTNFLVKQTVQGLDEQLNAVKKKTVAEQKAIHELTADWTFLNQPELLADLNNRYVHLAPVVPRQVIASVDAIPLRPAPPPPPEPLPPIASAPPPVPMIPVAASQPTFVPAVAATQPVPLEPIAASQPAPAPAAPAPQPAPVIPIGAGQPAHAPASPQPAPPPRPPKPASLDGVFAQVVGDR